jgi:hypothetical protein
VICLMICPKEKSAKTLAKIEIDALRLQVGSTRLPRIRDNFGFHHLSRSATQLPTFPL